MMLSFMIKTVLTQVEIIFFILNYKTIFVRLIRGRFGETLSH